jgi:hypothetical protein
MGQQGAPSFSQAAIEALRHTPGLERWNRDFETLNVKSRTDSLHDLQPLQNAAKYLDFWQLRGNAGGAGRNRTDG